MNVEPIDLQWQPLSDLVLEPGTTVKTTRDQVYKHNTYMQGLPQGGIGCSLHPI